MRLRLRLLPALLLACTPGRAEPPATQVELRPPSAFRHRPHGSLPMLTGGGAELMLLDFHEGAPTVFSGPSDDPGSLRPRCPVPGALAWWRPSPDAESLLLIGKDGMASRLTLEGCALEPLAELGGAPAWVEARWAQEDLIASVPTRIGGLRVYRLPLDGGEATLLLEDGAADDVVLSASLAPRFLLEREPVRHGKGIQFEWVTLRDSDGVNVAERVVQPWWVEDKAPVPHVGDGPVQLLGGGDLVSWMQLGPEGFEARRPSAWADATRVLLDPERQSIQASAEDAERLRWSGDPALVEELEWLSEQLAGDVWVAERSADDRTWVLMTRSGSAHERSFVFHRDSRALHRFGRQWGAWEGESWRPVEPLVLTASDGTPLAAYLTRPDPARHGPGPYPLVLTIHGGPWAGRESWVFNASAQMWAERGYATLAVSFRGGRGFGWGAINRADFGGDGMMQDLRDGVSWAVAEGVADPERVASVGASYGGYAGLRLITEIPPLLRCAVAGLARGNLTTPGGGLSIESVKNPVWRASRSPDRKTRQISGPVLLWTGAEDDNSAELVAGFVEGALADGKPLTWIEFLGEGHGLRDEAHQSALMYVQDQFLSQCLGGPAWPMQDLVLPETMLWRVGGESLRPAAAAAGTD
ncbi:MAG: prolyl oligopeptidase family serine peptidase [Alphaproteobacteria bacterium]|nr:prolyl oligopeptidase family serine peptidase [Alphaproteobacteria bacterium]